jgi:Kef-type K+ transport system membrane component KefB
VNTEQMIVSIGSILLVARLFGSVFQYIRQPRVMGEMAAGIVLGPSVLGVFVPSASTQIARSKKYKSRIVRSIYASG